MHSAGAEIKLWLTRQDGIVVSHDTIPWAFAQLPAATAIANDSAVVTTAENERMMLTTTDLLTGYSDVRRDRRGREHILSRSKGPVHRFPAGGVLDACTSSPVVFVLAKVSSL